MYVPDSYWTSVLFATLSTYFSLVSSFCTLGQMFAADFFQIPPRDGHPCLSGYTIPTIRARWGLAPVRQCSCRAYKNHSRHRISSMSAVVKRLILGDASRPATYILPRCLSTKRMGTSMPWLGLIELMMRYILSIKSTSICSNS